MHEFFTVAKYAYEGSVQGTISGESFLDLEEGDNRFLLVQEPKRN
jgi:hypothetical protein